MCDQANLIIQEGRLTLANGELTLAQSQLDEKQAELDLVQAKFDAAMKEKQVRFPLLKEVMLSAVRATRQLVLFRTCWTMLNCAGKRCRKPPLLLMG